MDFVAYKRFKGKGIDASFNIPFGTIVKEKNGYLYDSDGRCICAVTSENGWEHFRPDTIMGEHRQQMLEALYHYYERTNTAGELEAKPGENSYWKNILRTMPTDKLEKLYSEKTGDKHV